MTVADAVLYARNEFGFEATTLSTFAKVAFVFAQVSPKVLERLFLTLAERWDKADHVLAAMELPRLARVAFPSTASHDLKA